MNPNNFSNNYFGGGGAQQPINHFSGHQSTPLAMPPVPAMSSMSHMSPFPSTSSMGGGGGYGSSSSDNHMQQMSSLYQPSHHAQANNTAYSSMASPDQQQSIPAYSATATTAPATQSLFGVVIPGRPCITDFQVIDSSKAVCMIENPMIVPDLVFFLLPGTDNIPAGHGAIIYYAIAPFTNWVLLGSVSPDKPSGSFRTGWTTNEELIGQDYIQLGISLEPLETIDNLEIGDSGVEDRFDIAHKIAMDLFRFTNSFCESTQGGMMVVPTSIFDKWMERFEAKYRLDPNFMLKISASNHDA